MSDKQRFVLKINTDHKST
jgi:serine/threonine protein kinase